MIKKEPSSLSTVAGLVWLIYQNKQCGAAGLFMGTKIFQAVSKAPDKKSSSTLGD